MAGASELDFKPPNYVYIIRRLQVLFGGGVLGISAWLEHGAVTDEVSFALACSVFTLALAIFAIVAIRKSSMASNLSITIAIVIADGVLALFWLSSMGATASLRNRFNSLVHVDGCYNTGSAVNSEHCYKKRYDSPFLVAGPVALDLLDTVAALAGVEMVFFIVTCVAMFIHYRAKSAAVSASQTTTIVVEPKNDDVVEILPGTVIMQQGTVPVMAAPPPQYMYVQQPMQQPVNLVGTPSPVYSQNGQPMMHQTQPVYSVPPQTTMSPPPQQFMQSMPMQNGASPLTHPVNPHELMATPMQQGTAHPVYPPPQQ